jgi:hypothetical protein
VTGASCALIICAHWAVCTPHTLIVQSGEAVKTNSYKQRNKLFISTHLIGLGVMFNATFNNISVILWSSIFLVEETGVLRENYRPVVSHWQTLSHNVVWSTPRLNRIWTPNVSGDMHWLHRYCKSNHHRITTIGLRHEVLLRIM